MKKLIYTFLIILFIFISIYLGIFIYAKIQPKIEIKTYNSFLMYDKDDNLYYQGSGSKEWTKLEDISNNFIKTTIQTEDKKFYKHQGFDYLRIIKAMYTNIISKSKKEGASTITQQYAKNLFLNFDKTWERKIKEMWITMQLETHYSKDEILEGYLNTINYAHGNYGIESAANFYFNKKAKDLTLAESALLAGIPKSPTNYSPINNYKIAKERQVNILYLMKKNKSITEEEYNNAINEDIKIIGKNKEEELTSIAYYKDAVIKELKKIKEIPKSLLETGSIKIYTNLDINAQKILEENINKNLNGKTEMEVAGIMMNPTDGSIIALIGGRDYNKSEFNRAYLSKRQIGSTMKPILYYAALENGFTASTTFRSEETTFTFENDKTYSPQNSGKSYGNKPISLATAISYSDNIYAIKTHMFLGEDTLIKMARRLGITADMDQVPSLALGTSSINIMELASAYSSFANLGYKVKYNFIRKVEDLNGNVLYQNNTDREYILNSNLTFILNELLTSTYDPAFIDYGYPTAINMNSKLTHKYSYKSGSTNTDELSIGYNPDILTAIWLGYDDNKILSSSDYKYSRNIWSDTMEEYLKDKEDNWYEMPKNVVGVLVNPISGKPATNKDPKKKILYYIKGTEPSETNIVFDEISSD